MPSAKQLAYGAAVLLVIIVIVRAARWWRCRGDAGAKSRFSDPSCQASCAMCASQRGSPPPSGLWNDPGACSRCASC